MAYKIQVKMSTSPMAEVKGYEVENYSVEAGVLKLVFGSGQGGYEYGGVEYLSPDSWSRVTEDYGAR